MKIGFIIFVALILSFYAGSKYSDFSRALNPPYISIRILDYTKCKVQGYSILLLDKTVSKAIEQIDKEDSGIASNMDTTIFVIPNIFHKGKITYQVKADYINCKGIISEKRQVERGWLLYETVRDGKIEHQVRSR